jgi:hypothetical protein
MQQVIIWAAVLGVSVFALGLVSAIGSRRLRKQAALHYRTVIVREEVSNQKAEEPKKRRATAMSAAAGSNTKEEEQFAQISGYPG